VVGLFSFVFRTDDRISNGWISHSESVHRHSSKKTWFGDDGDRRSWCASRIETPSGDVLALFVILFLVPLMFFHLQELKRKTDFENNIVSFLDSIVIRLRSGHSLKDSVQELGQVYRGPSRFYFQEIASLLNFSSLPRKGSKDDLFEETLRELVDIHKTTHKSVDKIKAFRRKIKTEQDFRRKSRQVTVQVRAQSAILGILFLGLLTYSIASYDFVVIQKMVFVSTGLFVLGLFLNLKIAKRFRWKV
jgi:Flp pilus assembly protein TadB